MRRRYTDGRGFEALAGYSRAVRHGRRIIVSGTTAQEPPELPPPGHAGAIAAETFRQADQALSRGLEAVRALGGTSGDVLRSRMLLAPAADWHEAARAHAGQLGEVAPANTTVYVAALVGSNLLVEVELEAEVGSGSEPSA